VAVEVAEHDFEQRVIERSRELPVVVDFWAEWCGPCRTLGPALEAAVNARSGQVELAKVDVDRNQLLAQAFGIRGIPAVKAFRDGKVVEEFTGAIPPAAIDEFLDSLLPSPADELAAAEDEESLRRAIELDPRHAEAALKLARLLVRSGSEEEAREIAERFAGDFVADGLAARLTLAAEGSLPPPLNPTLDRAFAAWDAGDHAEALEGLQAAVEQAGDDETRDLIRKVMVAIFTELGPADPVARAHRRRLAATLS
jgi:putative thioredoxin